MPAAKWLSRDPIAEAGGYNLYMYVRNNPASKIDKWGLCPCQDGEHLELDFNTLYDDEEYWTGGGITDLLGPAFFIAAHGSSLSGTMGRVFAGDIVTAAEIGDPVFTVYGALVHLGSFIDATHCVADPDPSIGGDFSAEDGQGVEASSGLP